MHELTGDPKYREWGWQVFLAFEKHLKVRYGYASIQDVTKVPPQHIDRMESFFISETLKYLYLIQVLGSMQWSAPTEHVVVGSVAQDP